LRQVRPEMSRQEISAEDRACIELLVSNFYEAARADPVLGPIFNEHVSDWDAHLPKMYQFWRTVVLGTREYQGSPFEIHRDMLGLEARHFRRWLDLFSEAAARSLPPRMLNKAERSAHNIARSFCIGRNGILKTSSIDGTGDDDLTPSGGAREM